MKKNIIASNKFPVFGPYSAAVEANDIIFISGQLPIDPATGEIINDIKTATRQVLINIQTILEKTGGYDCSQTGMIRSLSENNTLEEFQMTFPLDLKSS